MKREKKFFDCVIIDPPFFSTTTKGKVDQEHESARLINKVRPLINDGGYLVAINNALFVSGQEYMQTLEALCKDGYLQIREIIPLPKILQAITSLARRSLIPLHSTIRPRSPFWM